MKKIIIIGVILVMLFSLAACKGNELAEYKAQAKADLEAYAESKGQENYSEDNWAAILGLVEDGKAAVDAAENKTAVDNAVSTAKEEINAIQREVYDIKLQAKQTYLETVLKPEHPEATINDVSFRPFLGIYNGSLVAMFYGGQYHGLFPEFVYSIEIAGLTFAWSNGYPILVWNDGKINSLTAAYEQGLLTKENLITILGLYRK